MTLTIEMLPAREGDALLISVNGDSSYTILIDGGRAQTGRELRDRLLREGTTIDLLVVTHVDRDHIEGILKLLAGPEPRPVVQQIWFNGYRHLPRPAQDAITPAGAVMGNALEQLIAQAAIAWNGVANGEAIQWLADSPQCLDVGPIRLTVLGPPLRALERLRPRWDQECEAAGILLGQPDAAEGDPPGRIAEFGGAVIEPFDLDALLAVRFEDDDAFANASSISVLLEYAGSAILLPGDSPATALRDALTDLRARRQTDPAGPLPLIRAVKLPHHGSRANVSLDLLACVGAKEYLISTNGSYFQHPDDVALARVVGHHRKAGQEERPTFYFNYRSPFTVPWSDPTRGCGTLYEAVYPPQEGGLIWQLD